MVPEFTPRGYIMPEPLVHAITTDPAGDPWAAFTSATAIARAGFPVLPIKPNTKWPLVIGPFRHGARSATTDIEAVRDAWLHEPDSNVGVAPVGSFVILDVDPRKGGTLEAAEALDLPIDGYRERSGSGGWHLPLTMPAGYEAVRSPTVGPGLELKGPGSYVVSPHSKLADGGVYRHEEGTPFVWPVIPATWPLLGKLTGRQTPTTCALGTITTAHQREARRVLDRLCRHRFGPQVRRILAGDWAWRYPSASERDAGLALMASFWSSEPEVLAAVVMRVSDLARKRDRDDYLGRTVAFALAERCRRSLKPALEPLSVFYAQPLTNDERRREILHFVSTATERDEIGFVRLPMGALAAAMGAHRNTITNDLHALERSGLLETITRNTSPHRRERLARIAASGATP